MSDIRPGRPTDARYLTGLLGQLGYPSDLDAVTRRLTALLKSPTRQIMIAGPGDGYIEVERRLTLQHDERAEITGLAVDSRARRSGIGRALVNAAEEWAAGQGIHSLVVRSNVLRPESHPFYAGIGYERMTTSHNYRKEV
ncbi:MAG TPA: GNAT family N-acetyltransferase [Mycobacteriales bacterium]|nr:GNAT family N-acetyltransferase [Mycobacteriales bacterium]